MMSIPASVSRHREWESPLRIAVNKGKEDEVMQLSQEPDFDPNITLCYVIRFRERHSKNFQSFHIENSLLHIAILNNWETITELLLNLKANPNQLNSWGFPPLSWAIHLEKCSCAIRLLQHSETNLELQSKCGKRPIDLALEKSSVPLITKLLEKRVDLSGTEKLIEEKSDEIKALFRNRIEAKAAL